MDSPDVFDIESQQKRFLEAVADEPRSYARFSATSTGTQAHHDARVQLAKDREATDRASLRTGRGAVHDAQPFHHTLNLSRLFEQAPSFMAMLKGPSHIVELANPNYLKLVGYRQVVGKTIQEALPDAVAQGFLTLLDRVYEAGVAYVADSARYLMQTHPGGVVSERYVDFVFQPVRDEHGDVEGIFIEGVDSTERVLAEVKRERLAELTDQVTAAKTAAEIAYLASEMLGTTLGVSRVGFGRINHHEETLEVEKDWCAPSVETLAGITRLREYGSFIDSLKNNEFIAIEDVREDPRTAPAASALEAKSARSFVNVPVLERGQLVAVFFVNFGELRHWAKDELTFIQEVGKRTIGWVERFEKTAALRLSESRLMAATEIANLGIWELCLSTQFLSASKHCKENFGRDASLPFSYEQLLSAVHPDDQQRMREAVAHSIATGDDYRIEYRILRPDGQLAWARIHGRLERDANGQPSSMSGISQDITELMMSRRRSELLNELNRDVYGEIDDPLEIACRAAEALGRMLDVSRAGYGTINKQSETITIERDWSAPGVSTLAGTLQLRNYGSYIDDLKQGQPVVFSDARKDPRACDHADALIAISASSIVNMPVSQSADAIDVIYLNSATVRPWTSAEMALIKEVAHRTRQAVERRRAERDLRDLAGSLEEQVQKRTAELMVSEASLRQSQKMEAVGQLTGGLAHDFNNLLATVAGSFELLKRRVKDDANVLRYIDSGQNAIKRAAALTHRLLAFSRQQSLEPKALDIKELIEGFEELIQRSIGPQMRLEVVTDAHVWPVHADPGQLENALLNLCLNARDAMPDGGRIVIKSSNNEFDERTASVQQMLPGQYVAISVSDGGTGMTPEVIARAFDPFFTTKPIGLGTGLGLSMVYGFARQSGGHAAIHSEIGVGTKVCIYLPRHEGELGVESEAVDTSQNVPVEGLGETILVVDDEASLRMLMVESLRELGYRVLEAGDGARAMDWLKSDRSIQLLVTDVGLPGGMNGRHLADAARVINPDLEVLFVTGYAEKAAIGHGMLPAGMQVITKPFDLDAFGRKVQILIEGAPGQVAMSD